MSDASRYFDEAALDMRAVGAASVPLLRDDGRQRLLEAVTP